MIQQEKKENYTSKIGFKCSNKTWRKIKAYRYIENIDDLHTALEQLALKGYENWREGKN